MNNRPTNNNPLGIDYIIESISYFSDTYSLGQLARVSRKTHEVMEKSQVLWKKRLQQHYPVEFQNACQNLPSTDSKSEAVSYYKQFTRYANKECQSWSPRSKKVVKALRENNIESVIKAEIDLKELLNYLRAGVLSTWEENYCARYQHVLNYFFQKVLSSKLPSLERDAHGYSLLEWAALLNQKDIISAFINKNGGGNFNEALEHLNNALFLAACEGHIDMVEFLLTTKGIQVNAVGRGDNRTPLHVAAEYGHIKIVELLLNTTSILVNTSAGEDEARPIYVAARNGHVKVVELLLKAPGIEAHANRFGFTPFYVAAANGHIKIVALLLNTPDIRVNGLRLDRIPLCIAAQNGHVEVVELLLKAPDIEVNATNMHGFTPLYVAAQYGHVKVVERLLKAPGVQVKTKKKYTLLHIAAEYGRVNVVELILKAPDIKVNAVNGTHSTPLHTAAENRHVKVVELLLKTHGIQVNVFDKNGFTPLHIAVEKADVEIVELLLKAPGIQVNAANKNGFTPLHIAVEKADVEIVERLLKAPGIQVDWFLLHIAAKNGRVKVIELLLKTPGIQVNAADQNGDTPLHIAARNGRAKAVELLSKANVNVDDEKHEVKKSMPREISVSASSASHLGKRKANDEKEGSSSKEQKTSPDSNNSTPLSDEKSNNDVQPMAIDSEAKEEPKRLGQNTSSNLGNSENSAIHLGKRKVDEAEQSFFIKKPKPSPNSPSSAKEPHNGVQPMAIDKEAKGEPARETSFRLSN